MTKIVANKVYTFKPTDGAAGGAMNAALADTLREPLQGADVLQAQPSAPDKKPLQDTVTSSPWLSSTTRAKFSPLVEDINVDVAVIGAGITGITTALNLTKAGLKVALVEGRRVLGGETGMTTAHVTWMLDTRYAKLKQDFGASGARRAYEANQAAQMQIKATMQELAMAQDFEAVPAYLYCERREHLRELHVEFEAMRELGIPAELTTSTPLPFAVPGAIRVEQQLQVHPTRFLSAMLNELTSSGCQIYENSAVMSFEDGAPCTVKTELARIRAAQVVLATHAPLNKVFMQTKIAHYRSYAVALRYTGDLPEALYWDTETPYHYTRLALIDGERYLIVGGEDHKVGQNDDAESCFDKLEDYARTHFGTGKAQKRWSGQIINSMDGLPYIGLNSNSKNVYVATGYSGNGLTFGTLAASIISDTILGKDNEYRDLFEATRVKPIAGASAFIKENVDVPVHLIGDIIGPKTGTVDDVPPNEGRVLSVAGQTLAVFRDENGVAHCLSPVCPHLGCHVAFNNAEKTWDCPCHGSRFDTNGAVINGPALAPLTRKEIPKKG